jgi:predicted secreted hydrolase
MSFCPWSITLPGAEFALAPERPLVHRSSIPISHTRTLIFLGLALLGALFSSPHHASATPVASDAPREVVLPADDASHRELIEWWYYTGHLETASGDRYGFQFVVFEGEFGPLAGVVSHVAVTDMEREIHVYDQRVDYGRHPAPDGPGFAFSLDDWSMQGSDGKDRLRAALDGIAFDLALDVTPVFPDQELDTLQTTGIIYWEGAVEIAGSRGDAPVSGVGYVELTGDAGAFNLSGSLIAPTT